MGTERDKAKRDDWIARIKGPIHDQVVTLAFERDVYEEYRDIVENASEEAREGVVFHNWLKGIYVTNVTVAVRRLVDRTKRSESLVRLMREIQDNSTVLTREWYLSHYPDPSSRRFVGVLAFDAWGEGSVDSSIVRRDIEVLESSAENVKRFVDKRVAHHDGHCEETVDVTWDELNGAIDAIESVFVRYYGLLRVSHYVIDDITHRPWRHIFETAWVEPPEDVQRMRQLIAEINDWEPGEGLL